MRDYFVIGLILALLPVGIFNPYYGALIYAWISFMNPHMLAWTFAQSFPVAKLAAIATVMGSLFKRTWQLGMLKVRENVLMILLFLDFTLTSFFAVYQEDAWAKWQDVSKVLLMALLTATLVTDQKKLRYLILVIAFSIGFYGFKGGLFSLLTGGQHLVYGPGVSVLG